MSGTRFVRSGRCRFVIGLGALVFMFGMVAFFHSSQQLLDETREKHLRCEQQQEAINVQLQTMVEQKYKLEKNRDQELTEHLEIRRNLEQKINDASALQAREQTETHIRYQKLQQLYKLLQGECAKTKEKMLDGTNEMEKKLQAVRSEAQKEINDLQAELTLWKEKFNAVEHENDRLEVLLSTADSKAELINHAAELERTLSEYQANCEYKPKGDASQQQQQINKPLNPPDTIRNTSPRARIEKSFSEQVLVSPGLYHIGVKMTNLTQSVNSDMLNQTANNNNIPKATSQPTKIIAASTGGGGFLLPFSVPNNRSLILNSVENFQIVPKPMRKVSEETETQLKQQPNESGAAASASAPAAAALVAGDKMVSPLSAPRKPTSTEATKSEQHVLEANANLKQAANASASGTSSSSTSLPPLPMPPNQRKLPENVAPIPANFEDLLKNDASNQKAAVGADAKLENIGGGGGAADIDAAIEEMQKNENDDGNNNRYANAVNEMERKAHKAAAAANEDSGAHEVKDHDFINDQNFNVPAEEDNNFFDGGGGKDNDAALLGGGGGIDGGNIGKPNKDDDNEDDDVIGAVADVGDIAVKNANHLLDADNLNNEVAGDQGKEFPDGLRLEEGNDEDEDEDDYSNPAARQQAEHAIRN